MIFCARNVSWKRLEALYGAVRGLVERSERIFSRRSEIMPNWACGNIRIRGKLSNIRKLLENEIIVEGTYQNVNGGESKGYEVKPDVEVCAEDYYIELSSPYRNGCEQEGVEIFDETLYVNGSRRNFIEMFASSSAEFELIESGDEFVAINEDFKVAWSVEGSLYSQLAVKYGVDIKIMVWERGLQFEQIVEAYRDGRHVETLPDSGSDWPWKAVHPEYGG